MQYGRRPAQIDIRGQTIYDSTVGGHLSSRRAPVKRILAIGAAIIFLGSLPVSAQTESSSSGFSLAAYAGVWVPLGKDFRKSYKPGPGGGLTIGYDFSPAVQIFLELGYEHHNLDHGIFSSTYTVSGGNYGIAAIVIGAKFYAPSEGKLKFFGTLGGGVFPSTIGELTVSLPDYKGETRPKATEERFGYAVGGGLEFRLSPALNLLGELRFADLFPQSEDKNNNVHLGNLSFRLGARLIL
jgi:opacity protein-like surface antigen